VAAVDALNRDAGEYFSFLFSPYSINGSLSLFRVQNSPIKQLAPYFGHSYYIRSLISIAQPQLGDYLNGFLMNFDK
jgi:hypothetical protein